MKIGVITYHNTLNFGAALQCYALYRTCEQFGDVEIIDYQNPKITNGIANKLKITQEDKQNIKYYFKKLMQVYMLGKKNKSFTHFNKKFIKMSSSSFLNKEEITANYPVYDKYIIGSDQVWNYNINGMDTTYFFDFVKEKHKIFTFASSFGLNEIDDKYKKVYADSLSTIKNIAVRETKGAEIIKNLLNRDAKVIADPVFLLSQKQWLELVGDTKNNSSICTYFLNHKTRKVFEENIRKNSDLSKRKIIKLAGGISIKDFISPKVKVNLSNSPIEFVKNIYQSEYIFTDSFHATVFAILLNKKFNVFLSGDKGRDSRIVNLLETFNLTSCIFYNDFNFKSSDYEFINKKSEELQKESLKYLKENLIN